jgi:hypothetical protein
LLVTTVGTEQPATQSSATQNSPDTIPAYIPEEYKLRQKLEQIRQHQAELGNNIFLNPRNVDLDLSTQQLKEHW